ncbi:MAG: hypothetical protein PHD97_09960 [Bacteroidales bacterium]|nr:hypothetical protein [Bacteroidales bacterium]
MKTQLLKLALPIGMGMVLTVITVMGLMTATSGCQKDSTTTQHCTNTAYPLYCPNVKVCCPRGYAHYCDGNCSTATCPGGTVNMDNCRE